MVTQHKQMVGLYSLIVVIDHLWQKKTASRIHSCKVNTQVLEDFTTFDINQKILLKLTILKEVFPPNKLKKQKNLHYSTLIFQKLICLSLICEYSSFSLSPCLRIQITATPL